MGVLAWILAILGTLCAIMGIVTAVEVVPLLGVALTAMFWLALATEIWMLHLFAVVFGIGYGGVITLPAAVTAE